MTKSVAIVGAGWAGLSCAHHLLSAGCDVSLFEAAPIPGGRARNATITLDGQRTVLDNGQHMLIGAYQQTLALLEHYGGATALQRVPLQFKSDELSIRRRGPGRAGLVWGFVTARGLTLRARLALGTIALRLLAARWRGFDGLTVATLLQETGQPERLIEHFWRPLCVAAMNTDTDRACAQTFVNVLHDAMFASAHGSDFLIATRPLGQLLPEPMIARMRKQGLHWHCPDAVQQVIRTDGERWQVQSRRQSGQFDALVLATPPAVSAALLNNIAPAAASALGAFSYESIRTVYLAWPAATAPDLPAIEMLREAPEQHAYGQWIFDRGVVGTNRIAAVVISVATQLPVENQALAQLTATQVHRQFGSARPIDAFTVNEKRATFLCAANRPAADASSVSGVALASGLFLAGDYCVARYPATLESAVISGKAAAIAVGQQLGIAT